MKIGIAVSEYHFDDITGKMLELALGEARSAHVETVVRKAPGSFELPLVAQALLEQGCDGVVAIGAILKGETAHDEAIGYAIAHGLAQLSLAYKRPVLLGVQGPRMTKEQAIARIGRTAEVMRACIQLAKEQQTNGG
jgi:6,7-dimethyl-8-ribityllumazine synthase